MLCWIILKMKNLFTSKEIYHNNCIRHSIPGIIGFVKDKKIIHSNRSQLYLTLSPIPIFDHKYSEVGRVLSSLDPLLLHQHSNISIEEVIPIMPYIKKEELKKHLLLRNRKKNFTSNISLNSEDDLTLFVNDYSENHTKYISGPINLKFKNIHNNSILFSLQNLNLSDVKSLSFNNCSLSFQFVKCFLSQRGFLPSLQSLSFENINIDSETLSKICDIQIEDFFFSNVNLKSKNNVSFFVYLCEQHTQFFARVKKLTIKNGIKYIDLDVFNKKEKIAESYQKEITSISSKRETTSSKNSKSSKKSFKKEENKEPIQIELNFDKFGNNLEYLDISDNQIFDEGLKIFFAQIKTHQLKVLKLSNTQITSEGNSINIRLKSDFGSE